MESEHTVSCVCFLHLVSNKWSQAQSRSWLGIPDPTPGSTSQLSATSHYSASLKQLWVVQHRRAVCQAQLVMLRAGHTLREAGITLPVLQRACSAPGHEHLCSRQCKLLLCPWLLQAESTPSTAPPCTETRRALLAAPLTLLALRHPEQTSFS